MQILHGGAGNDPAGIEEKRPEVIRPPASTDPIQRWADLAPVPNQLVAAATLVLLEQSRTFDA